MKLLNTSAARKHFQVLASTDSAQAAMMTLRPGQSSDDQFTNEHPASEQWLFVVSGTARARVGKRAVRLKAGSLLLVEKREPHRVTNPGRKPLVTLNFYVPPAYTASGELRK